MTLAWKSTASEPERGTMSGTLPDGTHYSGRYFEVVKTEPVEFYASAWDGWAPYWAGWRAPWYRGGVDDLDWRGFVAVYTGKVIANLKSDDGAQRFRCRFDIDQPRQGLGGGGTGECQLSNGETFDHVVLARK